MARGHEKAERQIVNPEKWCSSDASFQKRRRELTGNWRLQRQPTRGITRQTPKWISRVNVVALMRFRQLDLDAKFYPLDGALLLTVYPVRVRHLPSGYPQATFPVR